MGLAGGDAGVDAHGAKRTLSPRGEERKTEKSKTAKTAVVGKMNPVQNKTQTSIRTAMGLPSPPSELPTTSSSHSISHEPPKPPPAAPIPPDLYDLITTSNLTPFRQKVLLSLCQIPAGQHSTYLALANHLDSAPRAVGNALRNNPFAPRVP